MDDDELSLQQIGFCSLTTTACVAKIWRRGTSKGKFTPCSILYTECTVDVARETDTVNCDQQIFVLLQYILV